MGAEKRLIDANAEIATIKENCCKNCNSYDGIRCRSCWVDDAIGFLEDAPTVDAVKVVRCRHCQYAKPYERVDGLTGYYCQHPKNTFLYGTNWERLFEPIKGSSDFCSHGERRSDHV